MKLHRLLDPLIRGLCRLRKRAAPPRNVLIVSAGGLGDTVLFSQVIDRFAGLAEDGESVTLLLRKDAVVMGFLFPPQIALQVVEYDRLRQIGYRRQIFQTLWDANYRLVIHSDYLRHPDLDEALVKATGAPRKVAMQPRPSAKHGGRLQEIGRQYSQLYESGPPHCDKVVRWVGFANSLTNQNKPPSPLHIAVKPAVLDRPTAVLQPFSAVALKQSPVALWQRIIAALPAGWDILLAGHPKDLDRNPDYASLLDLPHVRFEGAKFKDLAPILAAAKMVISVDTACLHLAAGVGAPTLCLGSAAYVGEIVPYAPEIAPAKMTVLFAVCAYQGCLGRCVYAPVNGMYPCVADLEAGPVEDWIKQHV